MSQVIHKYPLNPHGWETQLNLDAGAKFLDVQIQHGVPTLWVLVECPSASVVPFTIERIGTGWDIDEQCGALRQREHIATVQEGEFVWHFFWRK